MWVIKKLWLDPMENTNAYGYNDIGIVTTKEEADRICSLKFISKSDYSWPLKYADEFNGDFVPVYTATEIKCLDRATIEEL